MAIRFIIFCTFFCFYDFVYIISSIIYSIPSLKNQSVSNYRYYHIPFLNSECKRLYLRHSWAFNSVNGEKGLMYLVGFKTYFHINIFTKNVWFRLRKIKHLGEGWVFWHSGNFVKKEKKCQKKNRTKIGKNVKKNPLSGLNIVRIPFFIMGYCQCAFV